MSPEARTPSSPAPPRRVLWRDAAVGAVIAAPVAVVLSQIDQAAYRSGGAAVAILVVLGLAMRWTVTLGAGPMLLLGIIAQITDQFSETATGADLSGAFVLAASMTVVVLAMRRWEGDRRRARDEAEARRRNERRLQALVDLAHHLASVADRPALFAAVERQVPVAAGCHGAILVLSDGTRVEFAAVAGHDPAAFPPQLPPEYLESPTLALDCLRTGAPVFCATAAEVRDRYPRTASYGDETRHRAWAALPVPELGALVLSWREDQVFSRAQRAFLVTIANLFGAAADRIRAVERTELLRFVGAFDAMLDGVVILRMVRDVGGAVVDMEVEYLNPASIEVGERRTDLVGRRMREVWPWSPFLADFARVVETGEPFVLEDAEVGAIGAPTTAVTTVSIRASRLDDERIVLVVRDVSERARLMREVREANEVFAVAQELAHVGSWRYDFADDSLEWSAELYRIVGVAEGTPPVRPTDGSLFGFEHPDDRGRIVATVGKALEEGAPFSFDMQIVRQSDGEIRDVSTTGIVLLDDDGNVTGVWGATQDVTERRRAERFRREALDALERQRAAVSELQRVILPATLPSVAGAEISAHYRAATLSEAVGGDWYDAFEAPDGRIVLAIGDVAGHGIECAALANQLRVSVRVRVNDGMEPAAILALLDAELGDGFVTCWLATYEPGSRELRFANAGHLPAVLSRCGTADLVAAHTSPPLGTQRVVRADEARITLEPGDLLVLYTDGLIERRGEHLDRGLERLTTMVPVMAAIHDPAFTLVEHLAPDAADDVCVVTLRVR